jgi:hypothetical protein
MPVPDPNSTSSFRFNRSILTGACALAVVLYAWSGARAQRVEEVNGTWPPAPEGGQWTTLKNASPLAPEQDPFAAINAIAKGKVAYAPMMVLPQFAAAQCYFVLRSLGSAHQLGKTVSTVVTYQTTANYKIYDPQFSPDGRYILFKDGEPEGSSMSYELFLWDTKKSILKRVDGPDNMISAWVRWSADSHHIAFAAGGDRSGYIDREIDRMKLYDYDVAEGKSTLVAQNPAVLDFRWSPKGTLLFGIIAGPKPEAEMDYPDLNAPRIRQDRIQPRRVYEWDPKKKASHKLIELGFMACPSRDGKKIAYLGWRGIQDNGHQRVTPALYVYSVGQKSPALVADTWANTIIWAQGDSQLITIRIPSSPRKEADSGMAYFSKISLTRSNSEVPLGMVKVTNTPFNAPFESSPECEAILSKAEDRLFVKTSSSKLVAGSLVQVNSLQSLDLATGHTNTEFELTTRAGSLSGFAWRED